MVSFVSFCFYNSAVDTILRGTVCQLSSGSFFSLIRFQAVTEIFQEFVSPGVVSMSMVYVSILASMASLLTFNSCVKYIQL